MREASDQCFQSPVSETPKDKSLPQQLVCGQSTGCLGFAFQHECKDSILLSLHRYTVN